MARALVGNLGETISKTTASFVDLPKIAAPYTTVVNRARVTDFSNDLLPRMGIDRIHVQQITEVQGEYGPNGERVFKPINDIHEAVRLVGAWFSNINSSGCYNVSGGGAANSDYIEITFFGTGLNLLMLNGNGNVRTVSVSVDGGATTSVQWDDTAMSPIINSRNYAQNAIVNMTSGLSVGLHTVKIQQNNGTNFYFLGYEVVNASSSIQLPAGQTLSGSRLLSKTALSTTAYNSGFESGTLGTRGGHVVVYQKDDGTIAKAVTPTNASAAYLTSADHTNEEIVRTYSFREFGAGRADDWSYNNAAVARAFTIDDGVTTLVSDNSFAGLVNGVDSFAPNDTNFFTLTFAGTGLDVRVAAQATTGTLSAYTYSVDDGTPAVVTFDQTSTAPRTYKIVSGLPYGTHTVKFAVTAVNTTRMYWSNFIVYAPKTPVIPAGAVALADYFAMADYAPNTGSSAYTIPAPGTLRKHMSREAVYSGTWTAIPTPNATFNGGLNINSSSASSYIEYTFFGTGFEWKVGNGSASILTLTMSVDGSTNLSGYTTSFYGSNLTGFTAATGVITTSAAAAFAGGVTVRGLTLGTHKVRIAYTSGGGGIYSDALDIITPVHAPKNNGPVVLQNCLPVGSCGIRDLRGFSDLQIPSRKKVSQAAGIANSITTSLVSVPVSDLSVTVDVPKTREYMISYSGTVFNSAAGPSIAANVQLYIDGAALAAIKSPTYQTAGYQTMVSDSVVVTLTPGTHKIDVYYHVGSGTGTMYQKNLVVREL